ncbi:glutathione S-transferase family protein [Pararhodobacter sp. CCB-MM2]|uniref:glutathione S-transferase family protein n=1 Tax=Pararhodobacter sp. CCB-MM2 TaxID=1786003 RepID=UPI001F21199B|nr:glutathione S-transferase family protein [Pararhodobacter sp. CCB-MM2]
MTSALRFGKTLNQQATDVTYTLHYAPDNASLIVRLALEEMGQPYRATLVDRRVRAHKQAAYLALNPAGLIPVLETPQGPISETAAILLWLTEQHGALAPAPGSDQRAAFLKALFFASNTLHADLRMTFYPDQYAPGGEAALLAGLAPRMQRHYAIFEGLCGTVPWFGGAEPSVLDLYVAVTMRWAALYGPGARWFRLGDYPRLAQSAALLEERPSVHAAARAEGLGARPFTAPEACTPPEGSAL